MSSGSVTAVMSTDDAKQPLPHPSVERARVRQPRRRPLDLGAFEYAGSAEHK